MGVPNLQISSVLGMEHGAQEWESENKTENFISLSVTEITKINSSPVKMLLSCLIQNKTIGRERINKTVVNEHAYACECETMKLYAAAQASIIYFPQEGKT